MMDEIERMEQLLLRAERLRASGLGFDELRELGRLYRLGSARLSRLRERGDDPETIRHLNAICVRAYGVLYAERGAERGERAFGARLADAIARTWHAQALAWALLLFGVLIGAALGASSDEALYALVPESLGYSDGGLEALASSPEARAEFLRRERTPAGVSAAFGSMLFANNTRVGLLSFASGMLAGVPTVLLQVYNGVVLGALTSVFARDPLPIAFAAWILPHGVPELTAISLCAAAGLLLGSAIAAPGRDGRAAALRRQADPALLLFGASIPLFFAAALVESFVRESALGTGVRFVVAGGFAALELAFLTLSRRLALRRHITASWLAELTAPR
jgi:uncharacterized membrane protein SpoIIM required for sporulation